MSERATAKTIWEDNPDTPITASGLSNSFDYLSEGKFIYYTNTDQDYESWADVVITIVPWPQPEDYAGKLVYNRTEQNAKRSVFSSGVHQWIDTPTPYRRILKILPKTKITTSFLHKNGKTKYESFQFDDQQIFTIDDLLLEETYSSNSFYSIYLYHHYSYGDKAAIKVINSIYDNVPGDSSWSKMGLNAVSPSGYNVVSYRKIGGFRTDSLGQISEVTAWDLATYKDEVTFESLKIINNGIIENHEAKHIPIIRISPTVQFVSNNVQDALFETREVLNNLSSSFYTNRRAGFQLRFAFGKKVGTALVAHSTNDITLVISSGFLDVAGTEVKYNNDVYFAASNTEININSGIWATGRMLGGINTTTEGYHTRVYSGIWRVFIDQFGRISLKEQTIPGGVPIWSRSNNGWYDSITGNRCIGKFSVSDIGGTVFYVNKMSVTGTLDYEPPIGSLFNFHGTMCPDGLIPCDGLWHDITGRDVNAYTISALPPLNSWGESWYEEAPDLMGKTLKMSNTPTQQNMGGQFNLATGSGSSNDVGSEGGSNTHLHQYPHNHETGTIQIIASGPHNHNTDYTVDPPISGQTVPVTVVTAGTNVATGGHTHNITNTTSGQHVHTSTEIIGSTAATTGSAAQTQATSSWAPYKEVLICIKK